MTWEPFKVGDIISFHHGALWEVTAVDEPEPVQLGQPIFFTYVDYAWPLSPSIHMTLWCPALGRDWSDYPVSMSVWRGDPQITPVCEMEVIAQYALWEAPRVLFGRWPWWEDPSTAQQFDVPTRFRHQWLRAAA